jgi:hypothetical protein
MSGVSDTEWEVMASDELLVALHDAERGLIRSKSNNSVLNDDANASKNSKKSVEARG